MWHSVREIAGNYESLSRMRGDKKLFVASDFIAFAEEHKKKYQLVEAGLIPKSRKTSPGGGLMVNTWNSNDLIDDYRKTIR